jgi:hypothetical protein
LNQQNSLTIHFRLWVLVFLRLRIQIASSLTMME